MLQQSQLSPRRKVVTVLLILSHHRLYGVLLKDSIFGKRNIFFFFLANEKHQLEEVTVLEMSLCEDRGKYILENEET